MVRVRSVHRLHLGIGDHEVPLDGGRSNIISGRQAFLSQCKAKKMGDILIGTIVNPELRGGGVEFVVIGWGRRCCYIRQLDRCAAVLSQFSVGFLHIAAVVFCRLVGRVIPAEIGRNHEFLAVLFLKLVVEAVGSGGDNGIIDNFLAVSRIDPLHKGDCRGEVVLPDVFFLVAELLFYGLVLGDDDAHLFPCAVGKGKGAGFSRLATGNDNQEAAEGQGFDKGLHVRNDTTDGEKQQVSFRSKGLTPNPRHLLYQSKSFH